MGKKNLNVATIESPKISSNGEKVRFDVLSANNQEISLTVKTAHLGGLIESLVEIYGAARVREAPPSEMPETDEFSAMPIQFHVMDANVTSFPDSGAVSVEATDRQGKIIHLHFQPQHFEFFSAVVEKMSSLPPSRDEH